MKFKHGTRRRALEYEKDWVQRWKADETFKKSVENRSKDNAYVFYDGPPFITGVPHHGTLLSSIVKDAVPRYWTMKGKRVERVWGWDCHGLPAENFVEKQLNITDRRQIVVGDTSAKDSLKFTPELTKLIKKGEKTSTFRLDPKNLAVGDVAEFITRYDKLKAERFGYARISDVKTFVLKDLPLDYDGHGIYESKNAQLEAYKGYYGDEVTLESKFTVYDFEYLGDSVVQAPLDKDGNRLPTITLEEYITKARESMVVNSESWEGIIDRVGRWVDFKGAYKTMDKNFMESVWWAFKQLYEKGKIYEGEKVLMYDTKFATPVSKNEVTMDNDAYQTVTDPSVYVKFKLRNDNSYLLAWTTTPWTLPANTAIGVGKDIDYVEVEVGGERLILAKDLVEKVLVDDKKQPLEYKTIREMKGAELIGLEYEPLLGVYQGDNAHKVWEYPELSAEEGTGIVHLAPIYGEADFELAKANGIPRVHVLDDNGFYYPEVAEKLYELMPWVDSTKPLEVWESNKDIAKGLKKAGIVWKVEYIQHEYPFNPRSKQRIMYRAIPSWFFDIQGSKPLMLEQNENINWFPEHLKHGRFAKNIEQAPDWNLSRDRFWATAMPVWKGDKGTVKVVGSYAELKELSGVELDDYHRPWVDDIEFDLVDSKPINDQVDLTVSEEFGYITFNVTNYIESMHLAKEVDGLVLKTKEFHVSLIKLPDNFDDDTRKEIDAVSVKAGLDLLKKRPKLTGEFKRAIDKERGRETIIGLVDFPGLESWRREIRKILPDVEFSIPHITLYTKAGDRGIGIDSQDDYDKFVQDVNTNIVRQLTIHNEIEHFTRIDKVLDCWFESGSMPFAQFHYPFENKEKFEADFPGDFIVEYMAQVRAWFYYVHVINTALFGEEAFKNVITTGTLAGNDGRKMSKSLGNYTNPEELMDKFSADSLRFLLLSSPLLNGEDFSLQDKDVGDVARKLSMAWNMYDFFTMYAEVDGWEFDPKKPFTLDPDDLINPLDIWIVSRLHRLNEQVTENMDNYNIPDALSPILPFLDDASNWYVRRSRRRFWKSEDDGDKNDAYKTLHYVLLKLSVILAPFTPFLAEELYQKLGGGNESVHLLDWPTNYVADQQVLDDMARTRELINTGLGLRMKKDENQESIKVRQPLQFASYSGDKLDDYYEQIIQEELNVKEVRYINSLSKYLTDYDAKDETTNKELWVEVSKKITPELKREGLMREVIRFVQSARKNAGLNVDDRINLSLFTNDKELKESIAEHRSVIYMETLAVGDKVASTDAKVVKIDGVEMEILLEKA